MASCCSVPSAGRHCSAAAMASHAKTAGASLRRRMPSAAPQASAGLRSQAVEHTRWSACPRRFNSGGTADASLFHGAEPSARRRRAAAAVRVSALLETPRQVASVLGDANRLFEVYDVDKSGELQLEEVEALLNSPEYKKIFLDRGIDVPRRSRQDLLEIFEQLDGDKSGALSRHEFMAMWAALAKDRIISNPRVAALGLCSFLDDNGDGKLQANEVKKFLPLLGLKGVAMAAVPVPDWVSVDYRAILGAKAELE